MVEKRFGCVDGKSDLASSSIHSMGISLLSVLESARGLVGTLKEKHSAIRV